MQRGRSKTGPAIQGDRLIQVLLELAKVEDESAISMRRVAAELNVSPRLLYQYVKGRDELFSLLVDAVSAQFSVPSPDAPWAQRLMIIAMSSWHEITRYPGLSGRSLLDSVRYRGSRNARRSVNEILKALQDAGLSPAAANQAHLSLAAHMLGHVALLESQRQISDDPTLNFNGMFDWTALDLSFKTSLDALIIGIEHMVDREKCEALLQAAEVIH